MTRSGDHDHYDLLERQKERVKAVHLGDRIREFVDHVPPGDGFIDWDTLMEVLQKTPFRGPWLFEVITLHATEQRPRPFLRHTYARAFAVYERIQNYEQHNF